MANRITKLLLLNFLIKTLATQQFQDQNHLSNENLSDDSRPRTYLGEQKKPEHLGRINNNQLKETGEQKTSKSSRDINHQDNIPMGKEIRSKVQSHINNNHRPSELSERAKHYTQNIIFDKDTIPSLLVNQTTSENKNRNNDSQEKQKIEDHKHLNEGRRPGHVYDHTMVTSNDFAYMVAVLKEAKYLCAGAIIDDSWVLTAASGVNLMKDNTRFLRVRLGSINYKKGGMLLPVKSIDIHPYFNSSKPTYDLALVMLAKPVRHTAKLNSIRLQLMPKEVTSTHFIMTSWQRAMKPSNKLLSTGAMKHHRILSLTHLHPSEPEECFEQLEEIGAERDGVMCLETGAKDDCLRDTGAPIVINGVLWGIISSWKPDDCDEEDSFIFATLVSAKNIRTWIHTTVHGHTLYPKNKHR